MNEMRTLVILSLALVACQAAFTGSLVVEQTQPLIQSIRINHYAKTSVEIQFQGKFLEALTQHISNIIGQVQGAIENVQEVAGALAGAIATAVQHAHSLGQQVVHQGQQILEDLLANILASFGSNTKDLPPALIAIIQQLGQNQMVLDLIHSTQLYQCLIRNGLQIEYEHLANLYYNNELAAAAQAARPVVRQCIEEQGGISAIHDILRPYVGTVVGLLEFLNIRDVVHEAIVSIIGQELYDTYVAPLLNGKGLLGSISSAAQQLGQYIASLAQNAIQTLEPIIQQIKDIVMDFVQNGLAQAQQITQQAAQQLIAALQPFAQQLGAVYNQLVSQLGAIVNGLSITNH